MGDQDAFPASSFGRLLGQHLHLQWTHFQTGGWSSAPPTPDGGRQLDHSEEAVGDLGRDDGLPVWHRCHAGVQGRKDHQSGPGGRVAAYLGGYIESKKENVLHRRSHTKVTWSFVAKSCVHKGFHSHGSTLMTFLSWKHEFEGSIGASVSIWLHSNYHILNPLINKCCVCFFNLASYGNLWRKQCVTMYLACEIRQIQNLLKCRM